MKYVAILTDSGYNTLNEFWFRSQYNTLDMDKVWQQAKEIADENDYEYDNLHIKVKGE